MIKQGNMFQENIIELTPMEKVELELKRRNEILESLGIETKKIKHKKLKPLPIIENRFIRCKYGIYQVQCVVNRCTICIDYITRRNATIPIVGIYSVAEEPYDLLDKQDEVTIKLDNGIMRKNRIYDTFRTKKNELRFLVEDIEDGEVIDITKKEICRIDKIQKVGA